MPTKEQMQTSFILTYWATKMYLPIYLVRLDERTGEVYFLAGEETEITIFPNGNWQYL
ncbi:DUF6888 family protein [Iningainema tapete]|uniref:DUF6888 domain-containing protein n=1 Tax=Iningainema tapete BLCC-T55 TaxID=2748662 RepID=A0A8J6XUZ2_9CYAN|nr:hypothetical protein [Iningainema tapete]MBD2776572.1 hypothetical protein [Iningainema tapete BLCC-T55]